MGADLYLNPPAPPRYVALVRERNSAVALYVYDEMKTGGYWERIFFISTERNYSQQTLDTCIEAFKARGDTMVEVNSDIVMAHRIDQQRMYGWIRPKPAPKYEPKHADDGDAQRLATLKDRAKS